MSLNSTPTGERVHIGIFGKRNAGKSSLINAITKQNVAIVSGKEGTTTDPVSKAMELLPIGPVLITDTPGIDDEGELGKLRVERTRDVLKKCNIAICVVDIKSEMCALEKDLLDMIKERGIPYIIVHNKADLLVDVDALAADYSGKENEKHIIVSCQTGYNIELLKDELSRLQVSKVSDYPIVSDLVSPGALVVLVIPIDAAAPKGRLILPQQQTIRELLEVGAVTICVKDTELFEVIKRYGSEISLVITDSQAFERVAEIVPASIKLTSFSILMARHKGNLFPAIEGVSIIDNINDGDVIVISEGCTHHRQCGDIGTQKLPAWIRRHTGKSPEFIFTSGKSFEAKQLEKARLIIHCGGCMLSDLEMENRYGIAKGLNIPMTNYGLVISYINGILGRATEIFKMPDA